MIVLFCLMVAALVYVIAIGALASFFNFGARISQPDKNLKTEKRVVEMPDLIDTNYANENNSSIRTSDENVASLMDVFFGDADVYVNQPANNDDMFADVQTNQPGNNDDSFANHIRNAELYDL
ncbi:hypothetical protein Tco_0700798 [Tanacetum coccineum]